ncbi:ABC transporter permease [Phenylobacterium sp.]|uniref:ABC transporter permease n=1 Tax=Phenylobacterium sp. TaxID=1871053 RepID=UPI00120233C2|nr:ABC transporter permease [Phenylobacterium sp.]THD62205.1 MAG: FtsX-like permease family protein [Phenylobacterium sp.]
MSLALATLLFEWKRYSAAMVALAFSGLLILAQVGMFTGIVQAATATIDRSRADIMVLAPKNESMINAGPDSLPERVEPLLYLNPQVAEVESLDGDGARWVNTPAPGKKAVTTYVNTFDVDPRPGSVTLPTDFPESIRLALMEPYAVVIDKTALPRLGTSLGATASLSGKTVHVRGVLENYPNVDQPSVYMSRDTMHLLGMGAKGGKTGPLMVRLRDPTQARQVVEQLNKVSGGLYRAWTREDLSKANESALMGEQIIGIFLGFSLFLGLLIGVGITSQTLRGAILASIKEFASLRALGVSMGSLSRIVLELALWVGVAGLLATALFTFGVYMLGQSLGMPMGFPMPWIITVTVLLLVISVLSGLFSLGVLKRSQPADLLR